MLKADIPCPMCTQTIDKLGDHATCCSKAGDLIVRHNNLRNLVDRIAQDAQTPSWKRRVSLAPRQVAALETSRSACGPRVRASQSTSQSLPRSLRGTFDLEEPCEDYAALQKHAKYDADFKDSDYFFAALVFETTGAILASCHRSSLRACRLGHEFSSYCGRAWARLSCDLQRSVSQAILTRCDGQAGSVRRVSPRESPRESPPVLRESPRGSPRESPRTHAETHE